MEYSFGIDWDSILVQDREDEPAHEENIVIYVLLHMPITLYSIKLTGKALRMDFAKYRKVDKLQGRRKSIWYAAAYSVHILSQIK